MFRDKTVPVSPDILDEAIEWLDKWNNTDSKYSLATTTCEACLVGFQDSSVS